MKTVYSSQVREGPAKAKHKHLTTSFLSRFLSDTQTERPVTEEGTLPCDGLAFSFALRTETSVLCHVGVSVFLGNSEPSLQSQRLCAFLSEGTVLRSPDRSGGTNKSASKTSSFS